MKYIFITGGVASSLGKGITSASIGALLESMGIKIGFLKLDPYLNIDPGTISPFQHGEVYVTKDGAETDLDLGHYERFTEADITRFSNATTGQIYSSILKKERKGKYLGQTLQIIPHVTDEIKNRIYKASKDCDFLLTEIGGTVGDIESLPFIEAVRQVAYENNSDVLFFHLTLVPRVVSGQERKTKPTQNSVRDIRALGVQPDILLCRCDGYLSLEEKKKIALFTNVLEENVISVPNIDSVYSIPLVLERQSLGNNILKKLNIAPKSCDLNKFTIANNKYENTTSVIKIAMIGKYTCLSDAYKSVNEALFHAGLESGLKVEILYIDSEKLEDKWDDRINDADGILVPGGFGDRGIEGKILAVKFARENNIPFLGICMGMQVAVIEFARNVYMYKDANSTEFNLDSSFPIISLASQWEDSDGYVQKRSLSDDVGGSMRLGQHKCLLSGSLVKIYNADSVMERHRHRYEVNGKLFKKMEGGEMVASGHSVDMNLIEIIEIPSHKWFVGCQFHPEFQSKLSSPHPLFSGFVRSCKE